MNGNDSIERNLRDYVLGQADPGAFEERLMEDDEFFRQVTDATEVVECDLIEEYLAGELTSEERAAFERHLSNSSDLREKLLISKGLETLANRRAPWFERVREWIGPVLPPSPAPALATALAVAVVAGGSWTVARLGQLEGQLELAEARSAELGDLSEALRGELAAERQRAVSITQELAETRSRLEGRPPSRPAAAAVMSFTLIPGLSRSEGETTRVTVALGQSVVELKLDVGIDDYSGYEATLFDSNDEEQFSASGLPTRSEGDTVYVVLYVPVQTLTHDDYQVRLRGDLGEGETERIGEYNFRVIPR